MTLIAVMTIPISVLGAVVCLYYTNNTINVMTLAGLSLAIGPLVDSAIICLENTHRHLGLGTSPLEAAYRGASEVALPELVASCCTLLVLAPLAFVPGLGPFLFRPMDELQSRLAWVRGALGRIRKSQHLFRPLQGFPRGITGSGALVISQKFADGAG